MTVWIIDGDASRGGGMFMHRVVDFTYYYK